VNYQNQSYKIQHLAVQLEEQPLARQRQTRPLTFSAILEGLWLFLTLMDILDYFPLEQLFQVRQTVDRFWQSYDVV
jgi:hypothetical protein